MAAGEPPRRVSAWRVLPRVGRRPSKSVGSSGADQKVAETESAQLARVKLDIYDVIPHFAPLLDLALPDRAAASRAKWGRGQKGDGCSPQAVVGGGPEPAPVHRSRRTARYTNCRRQRATSQFTATVTVIVFRVAIVDTPAHGAPQTLRVAVLATEERSRRSPHYRRAFHALETRPALAASVPGKGGSLSRGPASPGTACASCGWSRDTNPRLRSGEMILTRL